MTEAVITADSGIKRDKSLLNLEIISRRRFYHEEQQRKGTARPPGTARCARYLRFFGYDTLQKSKLVTDENGVTSQNGGIKLGLDLAGGVSITYQAKGRESERRGYVRYPVQAAAESTELQL